MLFWVCMCTSTHAHIHTFLPYSLAPSHANIRIHSVTNSLTEEYRGQRSKTLQFQADAFYWYMARWISNQPLKQECKHPKVMSSTLAETPKGAGEEKEKKSRKKAKKKRANPNTTEINECWKSFIIITTIMHPPSSVICFLSWCKQQPNTQIYTSDIRSAFTYVTLKQRNNPKAQ